MNARSVWNLRALFALIAGASIIPAAVAQPAAASKEDETVKLEKFVVTGSLIPVAADSPAVPITILSSVDIAKSGVNTDILQVLKKTEPYFYGANNIGSDNGNISSGSTNGGSAVALRNRATLVLINGRRAAVAPVLASGGGNFVDVSLIPIAAVERIEILSDGASATYGSDAVSGVVNIILKTNYQGGEVSGRYGFSTAEGKYRERSYSGVFGAGNDKTNVTISTEWKKSDPLIQYQRPWARGQFRTPSFAGSINIGLDFYYLNPSTNAPPTTGLDLSPAALVAGGTYAGPLTQGQVALNFDLAAYPTMLISAQRRSVVAAVDHQLTDNIKLFGDFIYTVNNTESVLNAQPVSGNVVAGHPFNPFDVTVTARNRFIRFPRIYEAESTSTRGVVGMKGTIGSNWSYEIAGDFNRTLQKFRNHNLIDAVQYTALVNSGAYNPFARNQAAGVIESMLGTSFRDYVSELNAFDLRVTGEVMELPGGPLQMGFGAETRWESLAFMNDRFDQTGQWLQATPRQPFNARSTTDGFFAEARIPVFDKGNAIDGAQLLEFSIAGRKDIYSETADPFVPKYTVRWLPFNNEFAVRGTYSESFSAPTLYDLLGPTSVGFTASINVARYDTAGNPLNVNTGSRQYRSRSGSNPLLNPSESRNWTAGFVWSPTKGQLKGLEVSFDWFDIDERDLISTISSTTIVASVERFGPASPYAGLVRLAPSLAGETHFDDGAPITTPGQMTNRPSDEVWISNQLVNVAGVWQSGADIRVRYNWDTESMGKFNAALSMVYLHNYNIQSLPGGADFNYTDSFSGTSVYPRFRTYTTLGWTYKNWEAGLAHTFIPEVDDVANAVELPVDAYHNFDLQASYSFSGSNNKWLDGLSFAVGINNVLDEEPPFITSEGNQNHDINTYDPIGRFFWVSARYKF